MNLIIIWTIQLLLIPVLSPLLIGFTRNLKAKLQNRRGAPYIQPYKDLWKLFHKDEVISKDSSWVFYIAPYLVFGTMLAVGAGIPMLTTAVASPISDFLVIVYLLALGTFFLALSGIDTGGGFGGFGSSREMLVASLTEGGLILSLLVLALVCNTHDLFGIAAAVQSLPLLKFIPVALAFISFVIAMLAETSRYPFDNPSTHLELTMIHEAMILEYSGKRLALMEWAAACKYLIFIALGVNLFFPWGISAGQGIVPLLPALIFFVVKVAIFCAGVAVLESNIAKWRMFRFPKLLFASFAISVIAIIIFI